MTVTLITGTSRGIGEALVKHYLGLGHQVIGCSRGEALEVGNYKRFSVDISDHDSVRDMFSSIDRVDNLINCAGIANLNHSLCQPFAKVQAIFATNVLGMFQVCQEAARLMIRNRYGRIVNFSSVAAPLNLPGEAAYAASKAAVESLTRTLAYELHPITVNAIGPNPIETELTRPVLPEKLDKLRWRQSNPRMGTFADITNVVDFFLRPESDFVTGQTIYLGGIS